jgi:hypothetical protein
MVDIKLCTYKNNKKIIMKKLQKNWLEGKNIIIMS